MTGACLLGIYLQVFQYLSIQLEHLETLYTCEQRIIEAMLLSNNNKFL